MKKMMTVADVEKKMEDINASYRVLMAKKRIVKRAFMQASVAVDQALAAMDADTTTPQHEKDKIRKNFLGQLQEMSKVEMYQKLEKKPKNTNK
uniref:Uncharacterized protein n=1 Tax=Lutzomyia longipalpis TaxID=7200 RepID=A0A1B0CX79_LUTLO